MVLLITIDNLSLARVYKKHKSSPFWMDVPDPSEIFDDCHEIDATDVMNLLIQKGDKYYDIAKDLIYYKCDIIFDQLEKPKDDGGGVDRNRIYKLLDSINW